MKLKYFFLDVFTRRAFAGNQLAVVLMQDWLDAGTLLNIAREFGFSETAFLKPNRVGGYDMAIYTPTVVLPFAGHPTSALRC